MQKLFLVTALAVCSLVVAAPIEPQPQQQQHQTTHLQTDTLLQRPSPINPDVPSDPKPAETITKITDEKELAKIKRETGKVELTQQQPILLTKTPVVQPKPTPATVNQQTAQLQRQKRELKPNEKKPIPTAAKPADANVHKSRPKRDNATPLIYRNNEPATPQTYEYVKPQTLPGILPAVTETSIHKRDIPVPLTPKHDHAETTSEEQKQKAAAAAAQGKVKPDSVEDPNSKEDDSKELPIKQKQPTSIPDNVQVEDLATHAPHKREQGQQQNNPSTVEPHPIVRPHPVPVAELFNRSKEQ